MNAARSAAAEMKAAQDLSGRVLIYGLVEAGRAGIFQEYWRKNNTRLFPVQVFSRIFSLMVS